MSQNELNENGGIDDILAKKIESWKDFRYALREENALQFDKMPSEYGHNKDYTRTASCKGESYSAESLFMLLVSQQQKMINELIAKVSNATIGEPYEDQ